MSGSNRKVNAYDDAKTPALILAAYPTLIATEKKDALNTLAARASSAKILLAAVGDKTIPAADLSADIVRLLRHFKDPQINEQVAQLWGMVRESEADKLQEIARSEMMRKEDEADAKKIATQAQSTSLRFVTILSRLRICFRKKAWGSPPAKKTRRW